MKREKVTLGEISSGIQTGPFGSQLHQSDYSEIGIPVVMPKDLVNGKISETSIARVEQQHVDRLSRHIIKTGDILYSRRGDVGRCAYATNYEEGWLCGTGCLRVTVNPEEASPKFVFHQLQLPETIGWVEKHAVGSTMLNLNTSILSAVPINLPSIEIQQRIVDILSTYDDLIENNRKQIKLLEEAAQRLYQEWFVDLHFPGYEHTPITDGIPEGWSVTKIGELSSVLRRGISPKYNDDAQYIVINQKCIRKSVVSYEEARKQEKPYPEELNLRDGDTVICSTGAGTLGRVGQIYGNCPNTTLDSHVTLVRAAENIGVQYVYQSIKSQQEFLMTMGKGSTNQLELSRGTIQDLRVYHPTDDIMKKFEAVLQPIHDKIGTLDKMIADLICVRDRLLLKLMSGEMI